MSASDSGFNSLWRRFMNKVVEEADLQGRFNDRDVSTKTPREIEDLEDAQRLSENASSVTIS